MGVDVHVAGWTRCRPVPVTWLRLASWRGLSDRYPGTKSEDGVGTPMSRPFAVRTDGLSAVVLQYRTGQFGLLRPDAGVMEDKSPCGAGAHVAAGLPPPRSGLASWIKNTVCGRRDVWSRQLF